VAAARSLCLLARYLNSSVFFEHVLYNAKSGWVRNILKIIFFRILAIILDGAGLGFHFVVLAGLHSRKWQSVDWRCTFY
jgi:hypothetical protein